MLVAANKKNYTAAAKRKLSDGTHTYVDIKGRVIC